MALNKKITDKIKQKAADNDFMRANMIYLLSQVDEGKQPKRVIETVLNGIK